MGGIHDASGSYYGVTTATGSPGNATGWVVGGGIKLNAPMIGPGDYFSAQVNYSEGAGGYVDDGATIAVPQSGGVANTPAGSYCLQRWRHRQVGQYGLGLVTDSVTGLAGSTQLTTTWGVNAAYEHFWNKSWQTSVYGSYTATSYKTTANAALCAVEAVAAGPMSSTAGCTNNWDYWVVGSRTQWNIDSQTYMGLDVIYENLDTASNTADGNRCDPFHNFRSRLAVRTFGDQGALFSRLVSIVTSIPDRLIKVG